MWITRRLWYWSLNWVADVVIFNHHCVFTFFRQLVTQPTLYVQLLYAATCALPVGWLLGVLPPLDALVLWLMEQVLVIFMGGSPLPTDAR